MPSLDEVARRYQTLDFGPVDDDEITKVEAVEEDTDQPFIEVGYSSFVDPSVLAVYRRPTRLIRHRTNRPMGHARRRGCNGRARGSRRSAGIRTGQDPGDPELDPDSPAGFPIPKRWIRQKRSTPVGSPSEVEVPA